MPTNANNPIGADITIVMPVQNQKDSTRVAVDPSLLEWAEYWYPISWKGVLAGGIITAVGACATIAFLLVQWRTTSIREEQSDWRTSVLESDTVKARAELGTAQADIAKANAQIAEATARTKEAELKLEQVRKHLEHRRLADEEVFLKPLRGLPAARFRILYARETTDVFPLAVSLIIALQKIGWIAIENPRPIEAKDSKMPGIPAIPDGSPMSVGAQSVGISVAVNDVESPLGDALMKAFVAAFGEGNVGRNTTLSDDSFIIVIAPRL